MFWNLSKEYKETWLGYLNAAQTVQIYFNWKKNAGTEVVTCQIWWSTEVTLKISSDRCTWSPCIKISLHDFCRNNRSNASWRSFLFYVCPGKHYEQDRVRDLRCAVMGECSMCSPAAIFEKFLSSDIIFSATGYIDVLKRCIRSPAVAWWAVWELMIRLVWCLQLHLWPFVGTMTPVL